MNGLIVLAILATVLTFIALFFALLINVMQRTARRDADEALTKLRDKTLKLFDRAEALKVRQQRLLGTGVPDVPTPAGETERTLEAAGKKLHELLDAFTELQQRLDRARQLVDEEGKWGRKLLDEARDLALEKETASDRGRAAGDEAERLLARLESAPQRAVAALGLIPPDRAAELEKRLKVDPLGTAEAAEKLKAR